jgi:hypothetical protein
MSMYAIESTVLFIIALIKVITPLALMFSGACAWIASRWPPPQTPGFWRVINLLVNLAGGNVMYATNQATDRRQTPRPRTTEMPDINGDIKKHYRDIL